MRAISRWGLLNHYCKSCLVWCGLVMICVASDNGHSPTGIDYYGFISIFIMMEWNGAWRLILSMTQIFDRISRGHMKWHTQICKEFLRNNPRYPFIRFIMKEPLIALNPFRTQRVLLTIQVLPI